MYLLMLSVCTITIKPFIITQCNWYVTKLVYAACVACLEYGGVCISEASDTFLVGMAIHTCAAERYEAAFQSCTFVRKANQRLHVPVLLQLQLLDHAAVVGIFV